LLSEVSLIGILRTVNDETLRVSFASAGQCLSLEIETPWLRSGGPSNSSYDICLSCFYDKINLILTSSDIYLLISLGKYQSGSAELGWRLTLCKSSRSLVTGRWRDGGERPRRTRGCRASLG